MGGRRSVGAVPGRLLNAPCRPGRPFDDVVDNRVVGRCWRIVAASRQTEQILAQPAAPSLPSRFLDGVHHETIANSAADI